jgi:hypothetical protein
MIYNTSRQHNEYHGKFILGITKVNSIFYKDPVVYTLQVALQSMVSNLKFTKKPKSYLMKETTFLDYKVRAKCAK